MHFQRTFAIFILFLGTGIQLTIAQFQQCWDKKTFCQSFETCVTWERGCSVGANCLQPGHHESFTECVPTSELKEPIKEPGKPLCTSNEIFARSVDKRCGRPPCPLRLGYNCYPSGGTKPTCTSIRCPFGTYCVIGESCSALLCKPQALCKIMR